MSKQNNTKASDIADFESMLDLSTQFNSSVVPRWQRKAAAAAANGDRFIPVRSSDQSLDQNEISQNDNDSDYSRLLQEELHPDDSNSRILAFKKKAPEPREGYQNSMKVLCTVKKQVGTVKANRHIPSDPVKILDAPDIINDYYLNLLSWSSENVLAIALKQDVYLWDASSSSTKELMNVQSDSSEIFSENSDYISSVSWIQQGGTHIGIGTAKSGVQLWDVAAQKQVRKLDGHSNRIGALAWNGHILTSGSKDNTILNHDVRTREHIVGRMIHHQQEVCGLSWSPDGQYLASGANDNTLCIWDSATSQSLDAQPKHVLTEHQAAVKALAWSPHERNLLATGGGTADKCIKFWNASSGAMLNSIDTGSQVCALQWSPYENELLSSHGYAENVLSLWKYPTMSKVKELKGHTARVLHMATSPDGSLVVSCGADESLRFWNVFAPEGKNVKPKAASDINLSLRRSGSLRIR